MVAITRIELVSLRYQQSVLPLNYIALNGQDRRNRTFNLCSQNIRFAIKLYPDMGAKGFEPLKPYGDGFTDRLL